MVRTFSVAVLGIVLLSVAAAADVPPAGSWKLTIPTGPGEQATFLLAFAEKDGAWTGRVLDSAPALKALPKVVGLTVNAGRVRFALELDGRQMLAFDGTPAKDGKTISGSYTPLGGQLRVTDLHASKLTKLDDEFGVARETFAAATGGQVLFDAGFTVLRHAATKKLTEKEVAQVLERLQRGAIGYGERWEREVALRSAEILLGQTGFTDLALSSARFAQKMVPPPEEVANKLRLLDTLAHALTAAGQADAAKPYLAEITKLEAVDYAEHAKARPPFKVIPFAGRKAKSDRAVLVEVFTGAECPPCAAVDLAFDGLLRTYTPAEAVLLAYHCHIPAPDPLTGPAAEERLKYYDDQVSGAPTAFVAGKPALAGGGAAALAEKRYTELRGPIDAALETPAGVKLVLSVAKAEKGFTAKATVSGLAAPGDKVRLRFALAEERVRFAGGNGVLYHHMVVRAMPGGAAGFPLPKADAEQTVAIDPDAIREQLAKYLDTVPKAEGPFPRPGRPLALTNLKLVAFVQNDATREVLHAVQVDLLRR